MLALFAYTGMRRAELQTVMIDDISLVRQRITIRKGKGGKHRIVFYPRSVAEILKAHCGARLHGPVFSGPQGTSLSLRQINNIVAGAGRRAGIRNPNPRYLNITPHLLRHSFARNWKSANGSVETLQKLLGHASYKTTMDLYGTLSIEEIEANYRSTCDFVIAQQAGLWD